MAPHLGLLDLLATVASQTLERDRSLRPEVPAPIDPPRSVHARRLSDVDAFDIPALQKLSAASLLKLFTHVFDNADPDLAHGHAGHAAAEQPREFRFCCAFDPRACGFEAVSPDLPTPAKNRMKAHLQAHVQHLAEQAPVGTSVRIESTFARQRRWAAETRLRASAPVAPPTCLLPYRQDEPGHRPTGLRSLILDHPYSYLTDRLFQVKREIEAERYNRPIAHRRLGSAAIVRNDDPPMEVDPASARTPLDHQPKPEPDPMAWSTSDGRGFVLPEVGWDVHGQGFEAGGHLPLVGRCEEHPEVSLSNPTEWPIVTSAHASSEPLPMSQPGTTGQMDEDIEKQLALKAIEHLQSLGSARTEYWCTICVPHRRYTSYSTVLGHFRSHSGFRPFKCPVCHDFFTRQHSLNYHMLIHNNETRFTCDDCGKKFRHPSHFKVHKRKHTGESPYHCVSCQSRFKTRNTYKRHLKLTHQLILTKTGIQPITSKDPGPEQKGPEQPLPACISMDFIHDHDSLHGNDEEVAKLSRELEKQDEILNQKCVVQIGSASSDEGSYYPSTESEFSSPDRDPMENASDSLLGAKEDFVGLPQFDSSPPPGLAALAAKFAPNDSRQSIVPSSPLQSHGKSPNLLETDRHRSAFNRFREEKKFKIHNEEDGDNAVIRRPVVLINPRSSTVKPSAKAILANINGQQVYLIPQETKNPSVPQQPITIASSLSSSSSMVGTSKLEQCLRYGSAAIQQTSSKQLIGSSYTTISPRISLNGGASRVQSGNRRIVSHVKLVQPSESSGANPNSVIGKGGPIVVTNISNPTQVQG